MVVPLAARGVAAVFGAALVAGVWVSVIGTVIIPRPAGNVLTRYVERAVLTSYHLVVWPDWLGRWRENILATRAAAILVIQLAAWLLAMLAGFALLLWPFAAGGVAFAFRDSASSLFPLGYQQPAGPWPVVMSFVASASTLVIIALHIAYLPALYGAFSRRETEVALLNERAGVPSWGPELLARTHYALGSGETTVNTLPGLYIRWERWAADVAESHSTYLPLARFCSPRPNSSWVLALLAVLDSAALYLSLSPDSAPTVEARLCLRGGFACLHRVARALRLDVPGPPGPPAGISLTYEEFLEAVHWMREAGIDFEREPEQAWPHFVGWRVNYERAAYAIAYSVDAPPGLWSGPRRYHAPPIRPERPPG
ncbi:MAG TPA: hypothetical protein VMU95_25355 [Trebonia sp.]|nr:hypothetical protein [Trebonia sp.]